MSQIQLETANPKLETDLKDLAQDIVRRATSGGATAAECVIREGDEFSTLVRLGQVETLKEAGSKSIGVRVFYGKRAASTYSSDFSREGLDRMLKSALELAKITSEDPFAGIPEADQLGSLTGDLDLYSADVYSLPGEERINYARRTEKAALDFDPRIKNSEGGSFDAATGSKILANSHGFVGEYRRSYCSVAAVPIAQTETGAMQRDYWYSVARNLGRLESPEAVGKVAAQRTLRRLGARKVKTAHVPVVFDPLVANSILGADLPGTPSLGRMARLLLSGMPELPRLRLSSLDPSEIDEDLWALLADEPRLMPHLHLSLQAGDDLILKRMKRRHSRAEAIAAAARARALRPDIMIGADLIAGFPTESEDMFRRSLDIVAECGLAFLHVFPYSQRPGTPAARMPPVEPAIVRQRAARLRTAGATSLSAALNARVGSEADVLIESPDRGRADCYAAVRFADPAEVGAVRRMRFVAADGQHLIGVPA